MLTKKVIAQGLIILYANLNFLPFLVHFVYLLIAIENKIVFGRVINFGGNDALSIEYGNRLDYLFLLMDFLLIVHVIWISVNLLFTAFTATVILKKVTLYGLIGLVFTILFIWLDPFGIVKYMLD